MIRVLQCVNNMHRAGLETMLMNYYRNIDRTQIQFDFLMHREEKSDYDDEIESLGGRIYRAPRLYPQNYPSYFKYMKNFFEEHCEYKIVHSHIDAMSYLPLLAAKKSNIPIRIAHSHSTRIDHDLKYLLKQYFRFKLNGVATHRFACGKDAGQFLFRNEKFDLIPNAIQKGKFLYSEEIRNRVRNELGLGDSIAIGHIGRFVSAKNHEFLIDVFFEILKNNPDATLLLVGTGENEQSIKQKVKKLEISERVKFLGVRNDTENLYQAMDVFLLPSLFEGIPIVGIEAQFSALPCVFSTNVPEEVCFSSNCHFESLKSSASEWANKVVKLAIKANRNPKVESSIFDVEITAKGLQSKYISLMELV